MNSPAELEGDVPLEAVAAGAWVVGLGDAITELLAPSLVVDALSVFAEDDS